MVETSTTVGIIANPASARDIRRIVATGGAVTTHDKLNLLKRVLAGLAAAGVERVISMADGAGIMAGLLTVVGRPSAAGWPTLEFVDQPVTRSDLDTTVATRAMVAAGVGSIVVLGGDGTNRVVAAESGAVPLVSISTGTNNAFPQPVEPTVAGLAAGLIATNTGCRPTGTYRAKTLLVNCGERTEHALVDVAVSTADGVGTGAVWNASSISELYLSFANADAIGLSAIGGHVNPTPRRQASGLALQLGLPAATVINPPIGPGLVAPVGIRSAEVLEVGSTIPIRSSAGVLALDGERMFRFGPQDRPTVTLRADGPVVVDVAATLDYAAASGLLADRSGGPPVSGAGQTHAESNPSEQRKGNNRDATQSARSLHRDGPHPAVRVQNFAGVPR